MGKGVAAGIAGALIALAMALALAGPAAARGPGAAADSCSGGAANGGCGIPVCYQPRVTARPGMKLGVNVNCTDLEGAELVTEPPHSAISDVGIKDWMLHFDVKPSEDAPRHEEAVFDLQGPAGSARVSVDVEAIPTDQNAAPLCWTEDASRRSDGTGPVELDLDVTCYDPDGDEFTVHGGGPGEHLRSPMTIEVGRGGPGNWEYRTATFSGRETTRVWAVDALGARSRDSELTVDVGPGIDSPPECRPAVTRYGEEIPSVYTRPGAIRRFAIFCEDVDGDMLSAALASPPKLGSIPTFAQDPPSAGWWGMEQWIDATYVPLLPTMERDTFSVRPVPGAEPSEIAIVPRIPPANGYGGCGWSGGGIAKNEPGTVTITCDDEDGDPLNAEIVDAPAHGVAGPAIVTPARYGQQDLTIPYVPDLDYEGYDCVVVRVSDGMWEGLTIAIDIYVRERPPTVTLPPLPLPPAIPIDPGISTKQLAQRALGTLAIDRLSRSRGAEVWARDELSRRDLLRWGHAPAMVVVCRRRCEVDGTSALSTGGRNPRAKRLRSASVSKSREAQLLSLAIDRRQRRALRRAHAPRGKFRVRVKPKGGKPASVRRSIRIGD